MKKYSGAENMEKHRQMKVVLHPCDIRNTLYLEALKTKYVICGGNFIDTRTLLFQET